MNWNKWIRQTHRWLSIVFTLAVIITSIVLALGNAPMWINYISLPPLFLMALTGLYLFALPYFNRSR